MRAVLCRQFGPPESLVLEEINEPEPAEGELLIDVRAASVSFPDALMIEDKYQHHPTPPFCPGGEVAGVVREMGPGVDGFAVGDRVFGGTRSGGFAERALVDAGRALRIPETLDFAQAAGLFYAYGTAFYALRDRGRLAPGETLLVLGAAGHVGLAAIEVGRLLGARVIAGASSQEKLELCRQRGAGETICYAREDLKERAKQLGGARGIDAVLDVVGGRLSEAGLRAMAWQGRYLVLGFPAGIPSVPLNLPLLKGCEIVGVFFGDWIRREPAARDALAREIVALCARGALRPHVSRIYPLERASQALRDLLERRALGKLVVAPADHSAGGPSSASAS